MREVFGPHTWVSCYVLTKLHVSFIGILLQNPYYTGLVTLALGRWSSLSLSLPAFLTQNLNEEEEEFPLRESESDRFQLQQVSPLQLSALVRKWKRLRANDETEIENGGNEEVEEPKVGMLFGTADEVLEYYKNYAKQLGFPVKKRSSTKDDDGVLRYVTLACARSGTSRSNSASKGLRPPQSIKTNCKALLSACICLDGSDWDTTPGAQRCSKMEKSFNEIKEMANDSEDKCVIVMTWMNKLKEELINHDYNSKSTRATPKLPIPRILGNNVKSIPKEGQSMLTPNYSYGSNGTGKGHHHQVWNGVYGMFSLPSSNLQGLGNQKPD
ncbi:hypothetical protein MKX01_024479 [Papaver californicum]|nr:hypothetical protein MKX01_024479 [Papaver californicum]